MRIAPDGRLVREQARPRPEISEIGEDFITIRRPPDAEPNLLPIPSEVRPMVDLLRLVLSGQAGMLATRFAPELVPGGPLWRVRLAEPGGAEKVSLFLLGCGAALRGIEILEGGGVRRVISFRAPG